MQLSDAMNDLQEQVKVEHAPTDKNEHGVEVRLDFHQIYESVIISRYINGFERPLKNNSDTRL